jgi:hypothetical protein
MESQKRVSFRLLSPPRGRRGGSPNPSRPRPLPVAHHAAARAGRRESVRPQGWRRRGLHAPPSRGPARARSPMSRQRGPLVGPPPGGGGWCSTRSGGALPGYGVCTVGAPCFRWDGDRWPGGGGGGLGRKMAAQRRVDGGAPAGGRRALAVSGTGRRLGTGGCLGGGLVVRRPLLG